MRVFVTGAAGYIGGKLIAALLKKDSIKAITGLDIKEPAWSNPKFKFIKQDIRQPLDNILKDENIDSVVHTAFILPPIHNKEVMEDINIGGTVNVLNASAKAGVSHILYTSSTTAYGFHSDNDEPLTEDSPLRGNDDLTYAKNKKEVEGIIKVFISQHPEIKMSVVRPCFVVGPGFRNPLANHLKKRLVLLPSNTKQWQFVHEDDLVNVMVLLLEKQIAGIFNVTAGGTMTFPEMVKVLGGFLIPLKWPVIYSLNNLSWHLRLTFMTEFPSSAMRMMINPWLATSEKLIRETGYQFKYDSRKAFENFARSLEN